MIKLNNQFEHAQSYCPPETSIMETLDYLFTKYSYLIKEPIAHTIILKKTSDLRRMDNNDRDIALTMFNAGKSPQVIANQLGFSCAAITGFLHRVGARRRLTKQ